MKEKYYKIILKAHLLLFIVRERAAKVNRVYKRTTPVFHQSGLQPRTLCGALFFHKLLVLLVSF